MKRRLLALPLAGLLALAACDLAALDSPPPAPPPPVQTYVLGVRLHPDTVAVGDTLLIHAVIRDSLDARFRFNWSGLTNPYSEWRYLPVDGQRDGPRVRFIVPDIGGEPGEVVGMTSGVRVDNEVPGTRPISYPFNIPVQH